MERVRLIKSESPPPPRRLTTVPADADPFCSKLNTSSKATQLHFHYVPLFSAAGLRKPIYVVVSPLLGLCCLFLDSSFHPMGHLLTQRWLHGAAGASERGCVLSHSRPGEPPRGHRKTLSLNTSPVLFHASRAEAMNLTLKRRKNGTFPCASRNEEK